jgi:imidazolonepropionase-like amidohydrolase
MKARELTLKARIMGTMGALLASTKVNADLLRLQDEVGTVELGKLADLILVDGDPTTDIACLEDPDRVQIVVKRGRICKHQSREMPATVGVER